MIQLVWFKRDLRTVDHRPLADAAAAGPVLPLYVVEPDYWRLPDVSTRHWLVQQAALAELSHRLAQLGAPLIIRTGAVTEILAKIHQAVGIARLLAHEETGNLWTFQRDIAVRAFCRRHAIPFAEFSQTGAIRGLKNRDLWAAHHSKFITAPLIPEPTRLTPIPAARPLPIPTAQQLGLAPDGCATPPLATRQAALSLLETFLAGRGAAYRRAMSSPLAGAAACSRLSVPLATGAVSVREILQRLFATRRALVETPPPRRAIPVTAVESLIARLHWRGHFIQKLESEPALEIRSLHPIHQNARHGTDPNHPHLQAWATGQTGIPFIDACMRSLIATGWLNFRMRAMVQSFAAYHLALDWHATGQRLAQLFADYEPGIHWPQIQMQSGQTGINTPRIYNPIKQGLDQDPTGQFTRTWLPELGAISLATLQTPWLGPSTRYPPPIIDPPAAARAAKARLTTLRAAEGYREAALHVFQKHGSRARRLDDDNPRRPAPRKQEKQGLLF